MTQVSDHGPVREVLAATGPVLLDFDGPVCRVYTGDLNVRTANRLRSLLLDGNIGLPLGVQETRDPLAVLRFAGEVAPSALLRDIEATLTEAEVSAAADAPTTAGAHEFLTACRAAARPVVIVSNNAEQAIRRYLDGHALTDLIFGVVGRSHAEPGRMKPDPYPVTSALRLFARQPRDCVLVGDSPTDVEAARRSGVRSIAFVKAPDRWERLSKSEPDALVDDMGTLARML